MDLRFLRNTDKREIDFVVLKDEKPLFAVECKSGEKNINPALFYFMERTKIPKFYQVHSGERDYKKWRPNDSCSKADNRAHFAANHKNELTIYLDSIIPKTFEII